MSIPRPFVEAYWLGWFPTPPGQNLAEIPTKTPVDVVKLGLYNLFLNNNLSFCFGMSNKHGWQYTKDGVKALQAAGIKVVASIIGTPDPQVGWNDITDPAAFARNAKVLLIDELGCDGIDIDNEDDATPGSPFFAVVEALRDQLGPKGSPKALLTYPTYIPERDLPWLRQIGAAFDWVSTMAYWLDEQGQIDLWNQYADVLGPENVLAGVSLRQHQSTSLETVAGLGKWISARGPGNTGGMMLWHLSKGALTEQYYAAIRDNLTIWNPPKQSGNGHVLQDPRAI